MSYVVTGATGQLGRQIVESMLDRGVPAGRIVAGGRAAERLAPLSAQGVVTTTIDYDDPATLAAAVKDADVVVLVSGDVLGHRVAQHTNVVEAAKNAGVGRVVYVSGVHADTSTFPIVADHKATEEMIIASGMPYTFARNNLYTEVQSPMLPQARDTGVILTSAGEGRIASAARRDYAEGIAAIVLDPATTGQTLELSGDTAWSFDDLAAAFAEILGRPVVHRSVPPEEQKEILLGAGLDDQAVAVVQLIHRHVAAGDLADATDTLRTLLGRPTTPLVEALRALT